ncbi:MAG: fumarylacetoacetate hydrolase family protein [Cyclobacteriaceae bacterium]|nr:fumarylacetoacetate hydrolase family protein [Cyclobacteriaceae bacterium]
MDKLFNLFRFGSFRNERPGICLNDKTLKDASSLFNDWNSDFFASDGLEKLLNTNMQTLENLPNLPEPVRLGSCIARPHKVVCVGLNYTDHARESGAEPPKEPILFMKGNNTVVGPNDQILIPRGSVATDWEVELGVVIGREARYLSDENDAKSCIAGYCISHDVSERDFQLKRGGQWVKGKSCDSFNPVGPWLVPSNMIDPSELALKLWVNGQLMQNGNTKDMIFKVPYLVWYISQFMTLEPGDLISTGTPAGVGLGMKPPQYLKAGDLVELEINGLGKQKQICVNA